MDLTLFGNITEPPTSPKLVLQTLISPKLVLEPPISQKLALDPPMSPKLVNEPKDFGGSAWNPANASSVSNNTDQRVANFVQIWNAKYVLF